MKRGKNEKKTINTNNLTDTEIKELKKRFYKVLNRMKRATAFTEAFYDQMNDVADDFTNLLYSEIDRIWEEKAKQTDNEG